MKIVFEGFYGYQNAGDDAFIEVASWGANKFWNCNKNIFIGASLPKTTIPFTASQWAGTINGLDRISFLYHLRNSDYLISAGGSTFSQIPGHSNKSIAKALASKSKRLKLGAIGVSIGPFKSIRDEKTVNEYLHSLSFLALRDQRSFDYANSLSLDYKPVNAFDLAALLPLIYKDNPIGNSTNEEKQTVGISICNYESYTGGEVQNEIKRNTYFKEIVDLLINRTSVHLKVFIINGNSKIGDHKATSELIYGIPKNRISIVPYLGDVKMTWDEIAACDFMISTRLHASIFACYANVPFMLIEYHKKCSDFLVDVGQADSLRVYDAEKSPEEAFAEIQNALEIPIKSPTRLLDTIERSKKNFTETFKG